MPVVLEPGSGAHEVAGVGRVGNGSGDGLFDAGLGPRRHAVECIHEAVGDDVVIGRCQIEVQVPVDAVDTVGLCVGHFVRADEDAVDLPAVVRRASGIAGDRRFEVEGHHRFERFGDDVLVDHRDDRHLEPDHFAELGGVTAGGVHHVLCHDAAFLGDDLPAAIGQLVHVGHWVVAADLHPELPCTLGHGIGGTGGV